MKTSCQVILMPDVECIDDLLLVIGGWGHAGIADIAAAPGCAGDGTVNIDDLLAVISGWGACPGHTCSESSMPQSVSDCMDDASKEYTAYTAEWTAYVDDCVDALCKAHIISCD